METDQKCSIRSNFSLIFALHEMRSRYLCSFHDEFPIFCCYFKSSLYIKADTYIHYKNFYSHSFIAYSFIIIK